MSRICNKCHRLLSEDNPGYLCVICQEKMLSNPDLIDAPQFYDSKGLARLLWLSDASVRRKARKGELPPHIPGIRKYLWPKEVIDDWRSSGFEYKAEEDEESKALQMALKLGWPIDQMTYYGHNVGNLISELKDLGYLKDTSSKNK